MSCCVCNLITPADFAGRVPMPDTIDNTTVNMAINETRIKLEQYLCPDLWAELCEQIEGDTLTNVNAELVCYIKDIWVRLAFAELFYLKAVQMTQSGIVRKFSNESENASEAAIAAVSKKWVGYAMNYVDSMRQFLKKNIAENPLFASDCGGCEAVRKSVVGYYGIG
jgi:hypothetical protein